LLCKSLKLCNHERVAEFVMIWKVPHFIFSILWEANLLYWRSRWTMGVCSVRFCLLKYNVPSEMIYADSMECFAY
jgi:hypothetical protein